jgi:hypothetical protein
MDTPPRILVVDDEAGIRLPGRGVDAVWLRVLAVDSGGPPCSALPPRSSTWH